MTVGCEDFFGEKVEFVWIEFLCRRDAGPDAASGRTDAAADEFTVQRM